MADKKVDRSRPDRTINPTQQTTSSLSETRHHQHGGVHPRQGEIGPA